MSHIITAIIDIGSNTVRLVLYKYNKDEGIHEFGNIKTVARLRSYIQPNGEMSEEGIQVLEETLKSFKKIIEDYQVSSIKACATAAIRQATNREEIIRRMEIETGILIECLSEEQEAYFGFLAVIHSMDTPSAVTIDIGGGSTEITLFINKEIYHSISFPFGTVSLKQQFVSGEKINQEELRALHHFVENQLRQLSWLHNIELPVIGIGGSARNLAQIHQHLIDYPVSGVHQYEMSDLILKDLRSHLGKKTIDEMKQIDGLSSDRSDIIEIALEVFITIMEVVNTSTFQISKNGLREGIIINLVSEHVPDAFNPYQVFENQARRLAYEYGRTEEEVKNFVNLTEQMYRECCRLQLFDFQEDHLELILNAAKVYSIGEYIELDSSNQHTFYLIANQSIAGLNHRDRVKLALLASYKNKDYFRRFSKPFSAWFTKEQLKTLRDFGALLKFVYAFNVSKRNVVKKLQLEMKDDCLWIYVYANDGAMAEKYRAEIQKKHIEKLFKKTVQIEFFEGKGYDIWSEN